MTTQELHKIGFLLFLEEHRKRGPMEGNEIVEYVEAMHRRTGVSIPDMQEFLRVVNLKITADIAMSNWHPEHRVR